MILLKVFFDSNTDYKTLLKGEGIIVSDLKLTENIKLYYNDYLFFLLILVPKEKKLDRVENVILNNIKSSDDFLFCGVEIRSSYSKINYDKVFKYK